MPVPGERGLQVAAGIAIGIATAATAVFVTDHFERIVLAIAYSMTIVPAGLCLVTIVRNRLHPNRRSALQPALLAGSTILLSAAVLLLPLIYIGLIIDFLLVPFAVMMLILAWVQPRDEDYVLTVVLGMAPAPLVVWFLGRGDERVGEGLIAGGTIFLLFGLLAWFRQRGELVDTGR